MTTPTKETSELYVVAENTRHEHGDLVGAQFVTFKTSIFHPYARFLCYWPGLY